MTAQRKEKPVEFVNVTQGWVGAVKINRKGDDVAVTVEAGTRVFLTTEEQELTERAHARRKDSPFTEREIVHHDLASGEVIATFTAAPLTKADDLPDHVKGVLMDGEEVGTPVPA